MTNNSPGYILFEGLDLTGKTVVSKEVVNSINSEKRVRVEYMQGFFAETDKKEIEQINYTHDPVTIEDYFLKLYLRDKAGPIREFDAIRIMDRYYPSIIFFGYVSNGTRFDKYDFDMDFLQPRHVVLLESDYESKKKRFSSRDEMSFLEKKILGSKSAHDDLADAYRELVRAMRVPFTTIDTSSLTPSGVVEKTLSALKTEKALLDKVRISELHADPRYVLHGNRVQKYFLRLNNELEITPPVVRKIVKDSHVSFMIEDGRHRIMANRLMGNDEMEVYVQYDFQSDHVDGVPFLTDLTIT